MRTTILTILILLISSAAWADYSRDQQKEIDRASEEMLNPTKDSEGNDLTQEEKDKQAAEVKARFEKYTPAQLKARININGLLGAGAVSYSAEDNYSAQEKADIYHIILKHRSSWGSRIPNGLAEAATYRADGIGEASIAKMLEKD